MLTQQAEILSSFRSPLLSSYTPTMAKKKGSVLLFLFYLLQGFMAEAVSSSQPSDGVALLAFGSKADVNKKLGFSINGSLHFCHWRGVACVQNKVVRIVLRGLDLGGVFAPNSLTRLDQLRVLSLQNNSLSGSIPDLSPLFNLKTLFLDRNFFTGSFPASVQSLRRLRTIDLSRNNLTGVIPAWLAKQDRISYLRLEWNFFNGSVPAFNQSSLQTFNVSGNVLAGAIPVTATLRRFGPTAFLLNPGLCGEVVHRECHPGEPFFRPNTPPQLASPPSPAVLSQSAEVLGVELAEPRKTHKRMAVIVGFSSGAFVLLLSLLCFFAAVRKHRSRKDSKPAIMASDPAATAEAAAVMRIEEDNELEEKVKRVQGMQMGKSGNLVFCAGEVQLYSLEQLMRASAELLGRGTLGTTYKAVLDSRLIVSVKRLDSTKMAATSKEMFERQMEAVGGLRHPNLVPLRAYFQAKEERLLIYDYHPNGSLFSLVHGTKSSRAKPLHWTSCLKIAEDVAQGLSYIHQAWRLVHGNLKSSNVLLGADFEACITDYCLSSLTTHFPIEDTSKSNPYKAPEARGGVNGGQTSSKADVYAFGVLLIELLTGKTPSQHPFSAASEVAAWVRSTREDEGEDERRMALLVEVATACRSRSAEQRPTMWQVLKMLQEIKESAFMEGGEEDAGTKAEQM